MYFGSTSVIIENALLKKTRAAPIGASFERLYYLLILVIFSVDKE